MGTVKITIEATVNASLDKVWECWNEPAHITKWNFAIETWHCPAASNDLRVGGMITATMAAKDGSFSFDFGGTYTAVEEKKHIAYTMGDNRTVDITFEQTDLGIHITETFDAEDTNSVEMQRGGWQSILNNFKSYTESF